MNDWVGRVIGVFTLTPYDAWRRSHSIHHAGAGHLKRRGIGDIETLTAVLNKVLSLDRKTRAQLARKAITNVRENFSQQAMCRKTLDVYEEILQSKAD